MLESAVGELWEHHRERNEEQSTNTDDKKGKEALEALSLAIAKVQFVQVYLEDSTIPLPVEESTEQAASTKVVESLVSPELQPPMPPVRTSSAPPVTVHPPTELNSAAPKDSIQASAPSTRPTSPPIPASQTRLQPSAHLSPRSRPQLTSSNFSWMLGEDSASSNFASGTAHSTFSSDEKRRMKGKGFLFGDDDQDEGSTKDGKRGSVSSKSGSKNTKAKHVPEMEIEEEVIDLDNMGNKAVL
jgi:TBC1 domain family protein 5